MKHQSNMQHSFSGVPEASIERSTFNRSNKISTSFDAGKLIPFYVDDILPGDTVDIRANIIARLATPIFPVMDNISIDIHWFFVPNRLVWDNWQKFCGEQENPGDSTDYVIPKMDFATPGSVLTGENGDYMGLPVNVDYVSSGVSISALPFRGLSLIWNEWYRDQNLQDSKTVDTGDADTNYTDYMQLFTRQKRHDYFTSCLPWPQKGDAIDLPLGATAPVIGNGSSLGLTDGTTEFGLGYATAQSNFAGTNALNQAVGTSIGSAGSVPGNFVTIGVSEDGDNSNLIADLSSATAATINSIREAFQLQRMLEKDARGGTRYIELVKSHFGVTSPDARLQRPEYLGGGTIGINFSQVENTGYQSATLDQYMGDLAAYAFANGSDNGALKSFTEHGYLFGIMSARADLTYQQGIERHWTRETRFDHYWPSLANLGEQEVLNQEIYFGASQATNESVFGYNERWSEYRYKPSKCSGAMRSTSPTPLDAWHLAQEFSSLPTLGDTFIQEDPPIDRVIRVPSEPHFICDMWIEHKHTRPMPVYSVPGMIDHL